MDMVAYGAIRMERRREIADKIAVHIAPRLLFRELLDHVAAGP